MGKLRGMSKEEKERWRERRRKEILEESMKRTANSQYGTFSEPTPTCIGDPFGAKQRKEKAAKKPNFKAGKPTRTFGNDGCFSPLIVNNDYSKKPNNRVPIKKTNKSNQEEKPAFKPGGTSRRNDLETRNRIYLFSQTNADTSKEEVNKMIQEIRQNNRQKFNLGETKRNMLTNPAKRGTYGYAGILLGERPESEHKPYGEPDRKPGDGDDERERALAIAERLANRKKIGDRPPFCSMVRYSNAPFSNSSTTSVQKTPPMTRSIPGKKREIKQFDKPPFRPSGTTAKALYHDYPKYLPHTKVTKAKSRHERTAGTGTEKPKWRPNSSNKTRQVRSIFLNKRNLGWKPT